MKIIKAGYEILTPISKDGIEELKFIEKVARTCYKSEDKITEDGSSAVKMVQNLVKSGHEAMLEHGGMTVKFTVDRGISHEIVRHRVASFAQESTRYCNYSKGKFGGELTFIQPPFVTDEDVEWFMKNEYGLRPLMPPPSLSWLFEMSRAESAYLLMATKNKISPQLARDILPTSLKTEVVMTANWREWRHFLRLRAAKDAHPQMQEVAFPLLIEMVDRIPVLFDDILMEITGGSFKC